MLFQHYKDEYANLLMVARETGYPLHELEREHFDTDHSVAGQALCKQWNIPDNLIQAVSNHHDGEFESASEVGKIVRTANTLVKLLQIGDGGNPCLYPEEIMRVLNMRGENESVRKFLKSHIEAIEESEAILNGPNEASSEEEETEEKEETTYLHVAIEHQDRDPLLDYAMIGLKLEEMPFPENPFDGEDQESDNMLLGNVLSDRTFSEEEKALLEEAGIHILKYRPPQIMAKNQKAINFGGYCDWLKETLEEPYRPKEKVNEKKDLLKMLDGRISESRFHSITRH